MIDSAYAPRESALMAEACGHTAGLNPKKFKKAVRRSFSELFSQKHSENPREAGFRCGRCGPRLLADGAAPEASDLWLCINCTTLFCLPHVSQHFDSSQDCCLFINALDSHGWCSVGPLSIPAVFCCRCRVFLYPRELAMTDMHERLLTKIIEEWLQILGRTRLWWREMSVSNTPGIRGMKNFGNTCFFTSTMQSLLHLRPLYNMLQRSTDDEREIQQTLLELFDTYHGQGSPDVIVPRSMWNAVAENALFGQYDDRNMEDASTLLIDVFNGMDEQEVNHTVGLNIQTQVRCSACYRRQLSLSKTLMLLFRRRYPLTNQVCLRIAEFVFGTLAPTRSVETSLSLSVSDMDDKTPTPAASDGSLEHAMKFGEAGMAKPVELIELVRDHFRAQVVSDYTCEFCRQKGAIVEPRITGEWPQVLVVHLKRFAPIAHGVQVKSHRKVLVPTQLDLREAHAQGRAQGMTLKAVIVHDGGLGGGHYMAYINQGQGDAWLWFSDQHFGAVTATEALAAEPYLLFYISDKSDPCA